MTDLHLHTFFSYDGREEMENYVKAAVGAGKKRIGFSEHYDYNCFLTGDDTPLCDLDRYKAKTEELKEKYAGKIDILFGVEFGFSREAVPHYREMTEKYRFDYVINSAHVVGEKDCYYNEYCRGLTKEQAYGRYLEKVLESVAADYPYQIVGHIGYPSRYAPFGDRRMLYADHAAMFDKILKAIVARGVCLELNTSTKSETEFLPDKSIAERYIELGGREFTFGSDAHDLKRFGEKEDKVKAFLSERGMVSRYFVGGKKFTEDE